MKHIFKQKSSLSGDNMRNFVNIGDTFFIVGQGSTAESGPGGYIKKYVYQDGSLVDTGESLIFQDEPEAYMIHTDGRYLIVATRYNRSDYDSFIYIVNASDLSIVCKSVKLIEGVSDYCQIRYLNYNNGIVTFDMYIPNSNSENGIYTLKFDGSNLYDMKKQISTINGPFYHGKMSMDMNDRLLIGASYDINQPDITVYDNKLLESESFSLVLSSGIDPCEQCSQIHTPYRVKLIDDDTFLLTTLSNDTCAPKLMTITINGDGSLVVNDSVDTVNESGVDPYNIINAGNAAYIGFSNNIITKHKIDSVTKELSYDASVMLSDFNINADNIIIHNDIVLALSKNCIYLMEYKPVAIFTQSVNNGEIPLTVSFSAL